MLFSPPPTPIAQTTQPTEVRAYRGEAVWSTAGHGSFTLTLADSGGVRALPVTQSKRPIEASVGRGPDGRPLIVYSACASGRCAIEGYDPALGRARLLARTPRLALSPAVWVDRLAWIDHQRSGDRIYTARIGHPGVKRVPSPKRAALWELTLLGSQLAISLDTGATFHDAQLRVQELDGSRARTLRAVTSGEAGRSYLGASFDSGSLYFAQVCSGDPSGCPGHGTAFRYRRGKLATAPVPIDLAGFAYSAGSAYWVTESFGNCLADDGSDGPCSIEKGPLAFTPR
jgi:hypothetical protein